MAGWVLQQNGLGLIKNEHLVGGFNPSEKYEFVSWDYYSQYIKKNVPNHQTEHNWVVLPRRHNLSHLAFYLPRVWLK